MNKKFRDFINNIKKIDFKKINKEEIKRFIVEHKNHLIAGIAVILFACISILISYAFYQVTDEENIIGGQVGEIADLEVRVMAQNRDANGNATDGYSIYPYIPKAGYVYNEAKSYCANGSVINYANYEVNITAKGTDLCYLYFDSNASLDVTLNVYAENVDSNGEGTGEFTKLETTSLPSLGYSFNQELSSCENGSSISYNDSENMFTVEASGKDVCNAYMNAMDVDIMLSLYLQSKKGSSVYYETDDVPATNFYVINADKSSCTGTSSMSMVNQRLVISATSKTSCVAYLDIGNGPIIESVQATANVQDVTINFTTSTIGAAATTWYYSIDDGATYTSTTANSVTLSLAPVTEYNIAVYAADAEGKTSKVVKTSTKTGYVFNGVYPYSSAVQTVNVAVSGYYKLETWGAQGGSYNSSYGVGGKGGYSTGIVHLNAGDKLYIHTGGQGSAYTTTTYTSQGGGGANGGGGAGYRGGGGGGGTDIRVNNDTLYARVIVAGGGGGAYSYNTTYKANGGAGGGTSGAAGSYYSSSYSAWVGGGGTISGGGKAGTGTNANYNGKAGTFGTGGNTGYRYNNNSYYSNGAGGGGWYGGGAAGNYNGGARTRATGGGGGSGFIYTEANATYTNAACTAAGVACTLTSDYYLTSASTTAGTSSFLSPDGASETGHSGNGYAKVTYVGETLE